MTPRGWLGGIDYDEAIDALRRAFHAHYEGGPWDETDHDHEWTETATVALDAIAPFIVKATESS